MNRSLLLALPLAALMVAPAQAQDPQQPANQPAAQQTQTQQSNLEATGATERQPLVYQQREGFWGRLNPFARKKYVRRQLDPIRGRVNELDELTARNAQMIRDVDSRATEGIRLAMTKATEADTHAVEAGNRANLAQQTAQQATVRLQSVEQAVGSLDQYQRASEAEIRFRPGQGVLSKKAKAAIDEMVEPVKNQPGYIVEVQAFSSGSGAGAIQNSQRMADAVVRYLVLEHEIPRYRIFTVGLGNAAPRAAADGSRPRRIRGGRVEVAVLKNGVADLAANAQTVQPQGFEQQQPAQPVQGQFQGTQPVQGQDAGVVVAQPQGGMQQPAQPVGQQPNPQQPTAQDPPQK